MSNTCQTPRLTLKNACNNFNTFMQWKVARDGSKHPRHTFAEKVPSDATKHFAHIFAGWYSLTKTQNKLQRTVLMFTVSEAQSLVCNIAKAYHFKISLLCNHDSGTFLSINHSGSKLSIGGLCFDFTRVHYNQATSAQMFALEQYPSSTQKSP